MKLGGRKELGWKLTRHLVSVGVCFQLYCTFQIYCLRVIAGIYFLFLNFIKYNDEGCNFKWWLWNRMPQIPFTASIFCLFIITMTEQNAEGRINSCCFAERVKMILALTVKKGVALDPFSLMFDVNSGWRLDPLDYLWKNAVNKTVHNCLRQKTQYCCGLLSEPSASSTG